MKTSGLNVAIIITEFLLIITVFNGFYLSNNIVNTEKNVEISQSMLKGNDEEKETSDKADKAESTKKIEEVKRDVVYDNMTLEELTAKLDRSLNSTISGYGYLYASYSLERGIDPYLAVAISLHETGCAWDCSYLAKTCNNIGGQKGSGCGEYAYFDSLENGIKAFIDNIANNYYAYGLTTADLMGSKYAASTTWAEQVNAYIEKIRNA